MTIAAIGKQSFSWPHSPPHNLGEAGAYMVTAGTHRKQHLFPNARRLNFLTGTLLKLAEEHHWRLHSWAVFSNHYHFIAESPQPASLRNFLKHFHSVTAKQANLEDHIPGRVVWFQYWDTHLTYHKSFLSRLNYVHTNAVRHGLAAQPGQYPWCSAGWFARVAQKSFYTTVMRFPSDQICVPDDYRPVLLPGGG